MNIKTNIELLDIAGCLETNCIAYVIKGIDGEISIWHGEIPEIDFECLKGFGKGSARDIFLAMRLAKLAMQDYSLKTGKSIFYYEPDNRDGNGSRRKSFFKRAFPDMLCGELYQ